MEITHQVVGNWTELRVNGRLDAYWSDHFSKAVEEHIRQGAHRLRLDLSAVDFLSSAGIRVLLRSYKQLHAIQGRLTITNPSAAVTKVLELSGLTALLLPPAPAAPSTTELIVTPYARAERGEVSFEVTERDPQARLRCQLVGDPRRLEGCRFTAEDCRHVQLPSTTMGLGVGALGNGFADCKDRFGEFLAVGGAVAYLPTDGSGVPDYLVAREPAVPDLQTCYAIICEGAFAHLARFETRTEPVPLAELVEGCLELSRCEHAGFVLIAETSGLLGVALKRSPAAGPIENAPFTFPQVRDWLSFSAESLFPRSLALVVGVAGRNVPAAVAPFVRPLSGTIAGHFHAAAFSYQPLPRGDVDLKATVTSLFEVQTLQGVLHLLNDMNEISVSGHSRFVRGSCWIGPIGEIATV
jgi:anti-sigma B factor antagonist/stage II sporulation protein AA (anti-sigma F factor antagonist)